MSRDSWEGALNDEHRPVWDLLEVLEKGPGRLPRYLWFYPAETERNRVALLLAALALGPDAGAALRDQLSHRDSKEKWFLAVGLGELGYPDAEGYFARVLRERQSDGAATAAVRALGRIRGARSLPLVAEALGHPPLFETACAALTSYGGPGAVAALLPRAGEPAALRALAELGAAEAVPLFLEALTKEAPWPAVGALGLGRVGRREYGAALVPLLSSKDEATATAAFESYARLGAPEGVGPLLAALPASPPDRLVAALGDVDDPAVHAVLAALLSPSPPKGLLGRLLPWRRKASRAEPTAVYRALRGTAEPECLRVLAERLEQESDPRAVRELAAVQALAATEPGRSALGALWGRSDLAARYFAARALLQAPDEAFLSEALALVALPGFKPEEAASPLWDEAHALAVHAQDNGLPLFAGAILDSGLVDLGELEATLAARLGAHAFPSDLPPTRFLTDPADRSAAVFLEALGEASPAIREPLFRLANLLADLTSGGDSLLDLGLCLTGVHLGGLQRAFCRGFPAALGRLLEGKDDRFLPALDRLSAGLPQEGPVRPVLKGLLDKARRALMAECHDMAVYSEGAPRGDMVLIEQLRGG